MSTSDRPTPLARAAEWTLGLGTATAFLSAFSGFPRFSALQAPLAAAVAAIALLMWAWRASHAPWPRLRPALPALVWTLLPLGVAVDNTLRGAIPAGWDHAALLLLPVPWLVWATVPANGFRLRRATLLAAVPTLPLLAAAAIAEASGVPVPPPPPLSPTFIGHVRATLDDPTTATLAAGGLALLLALLPTPAGSTTRLESVLRRVAIVAGLVTCLLARDTDALLLLGAIGVLASLLRFRSAGGRSIETLALTALLLVGAIAAPRVEARWGLSGTDIGHARPLRLADTFDPANASWHRPESPARAVIGEAVRKAALDNLPWGVGAARLDDGWALHADLATGWATSLDDPLPLQTALPLPLVRLVAEHGAWAGLALLGFLGLLLGALRREPAAAAPAAIVLGLLTLAPAAALWVVLALVGIASAWAVARPSVDTDPAAEATPRRMFVLAPSLFAAIAALLAGGASAAVAHHTARANLWIAHGHGAKAQEDYNRAIAIQPREGALYGAARLAAAQATEPEPMNRAVELLRAAIDQRPALSLPRFVLADTWVRGHSDSEETAEANRDRAVAMLELLTRREPSWIEPWLMLADIHLARMKPDTALEVLTRAHALPHSPRGARKVAERIATLYDLFLARPADAETFYRSAVASSTDPADRFRLEKKVAEMVIWQRTGQRPPTKPGGYAIDRIDDEIKALEQARKAPDEGTGAAGSGDHAGHDHDGDGHDDHKGQDHGGPAGHDDHDHAGHEHDDHEGHNHADDLFRQYGAPPPTPDAGKP